MAQQEIVYGIAIVSFLFMYLAVHLQTEEYKHIFFLKFAFLSFALILLIAIPKIYLQFNETCYPVVNETNETTNTLNHTVIEYRYMQFCTTKINDTPIIFNKTILWALRFYLTYIILAMFYELFLKTYLEARKKRFGGE